MIKFDAAEFGKKTEEKYNEIMKFYHDNNYGDSAEQLEEKYNEVKSEDKISLAFVGQYSAGKSTIIKALTGNDDIVIDSDIATSKVKSYDWNGISITDTPGLNTNEHKEHDEMSKSAIKRSDLLVYCITSDLFSEVTREDFKALAEEYKNKLFLVVNKMNKESGEYEELVKNYRDTINKTLSTEYTLADFHHFFMDAADYVEGIEDNDDELIKDSHFEKFIEELNKFISIKGLRGKLVTPINVLLNSLDDTLINLEDNENIKEGKKIIKKICDTIEEKKNRFIKESNKEVQKAANKYTEKGVEIALHLGEKNYTFGNEDMEEFSDPIQKNLNETIYAFFEKYANEVDNEVEDILKSEMAQYFFRENKKQLEREIEGKGSSNGIIDAIQEGIGKASKSAVPKISEWFAKFANVKDADKITIWTVRGSSLHETVLKIGDKLGHKFKPFEALKISKKIAEFSKWLGPLLTGVGTAAELVGVIFEHFNEKKINKAKEDVKILFNGMGEETQSYFNNQIMEAAKEFDLIKDSLNDKVEEYDLQEKKNNVAYGTISKIKLELRKLQGEINYN